MSSTTLVGSGSNPSATAAAQQPSKLPASAMALGLPMMMPLATTDVHQAMQMLLMENHAMRAQLAEANAYVARLQHTVRTLQGTLAAITPQCDIARAVPFSNASFGTVANTVACVSREADATIVAPKALRVRADAEVTAPVLPSPASTVHSVVAGGAHSSTASKSAPAKHVNVMDDESPDDGEDTATESESEYDQLDAARVTRRRTSASGTGAVASRPADGEASCNGRMDPYERMRVEQFIHLVQTQQIHVCQGDLSRDMQRFVNKNRSKQYFEKLVARRLLNVTLLPFLGPRQRKHRNMPLVA